jgi:hypothetical protein
MKIVKMTVITAGVLPVSVTALSCSSDDLVEMMAAAASASDRD